MKKCLPSTNFVVEVLSTKSNGGVWVDNGSCGCRAYVEGIPETACGLRGNLLYFGVKVEGLSPYTERCDLIYVDDWNKGNRFSGVLDLPQAVVLQM